ncbi:MAG: hypothetical protein MZV70_20110 [Desulfobacterales bacterium]|nr:hypothetical protein [Desulfobacterales bacterium]
MWEKAGNSGAKDRIERAEWIYNRHNALKKLCLKYYRVILLARPLRTTPAGRNRQLFDEISKRMNRNQDFAGRIKFLRS